MQDAVLLGRKAVSNAALDALVARGVKVHADDFSLLQRGISGDEVKQVCTVSPISHVVEAMENNFKVIWN